MTPSYKAFIFKSYNFDKQNKRLELVYSYDNKLTFTESFTFDFEYANYDEKVLDQAIQLLFFLAGISYYKAYIPQTIIIEKGEIDKKLQDFLQQTYQKGLGEFWYVNNLDPKTKVTFPTTMDSTKPNLNNEGDGLLVGVGGGKDSLVTIEMLRNVAPVTTWSVGHQKQLQKLVDTVDLPHLWVQREWDKQLLDLPSAYNGHIPISAILAAAGAVVAVLSGKKDVVVSNEQSANEDTLMYQGVSINHQYSKSQEFEISFQQILKHYFGDSLRYYSFLRPISELKICELFAKNGFLKYQNVFSSCNRAFVHTSDSISWCGQCAKCAFIYLALSMFVSESELNVLWQGKNLLLDDSLTSTYKELLGIADNKPLDCVGEIAESRVAMQATFKRHPELKEKYQFDAPDYDYAKIAGHSMPAEIYEIFKKQLSTI